MPKDLKIVNTTSVFNTPETKKLIETLQKEIETHTELARQAVERHKLEMYFTLGKHIKTHLLKHKEKADYGDFLFKHLSKEIGLSKRELYYTVQYYESGLPIVQTSAQLSWNHLKEVFTLKNEKEQQNLIEKIKTEKLSVRDTKNLLKMRKKSQPQAIEPTKTSTLTSENRGTPYTYRIHKDSAGIIWINMGFNITQESPVQNLTQDSIIQSEKTGKTYQFNYIKTHKEPHYVYKATINKIIDGDTVWACIELGFKWRITLKIRLRGIDAPPLGTPEGDAAKAYVEKTLGSCNFIAIKTYWRDKYSRYLGDIFYLKNETDLQTVISNGNFLNAEVDLLDTRLLRYPSHIVY